MVIRPLRENDWTIYHQMVQDFYHSAAVLQPIPESHIRRAFSEIVQGSPYAKGVLLLQDEKPAGYGLLAITFSQEAGGQVWWIDELYIRPEFRGQGLGSQFLRLLEKESTPAWLRLEIEPGNSRADALYHRLGFRTLGFQSLYFPFDRRHRPDRATELDTNPIWG